MTPWKPPANPERTPAGESGRRWSVGAVIGAVLGTVLVVAGLFVVGMFVLVGVGLSHWGSNK